MVGARTDRAIRGAERNARGCRHHAPVARVRCAFRPPDPPLEPQDEALHPHGAQRHLHHRPAGLIGLHRPRLRVRQSDRGPRRDHPVRRNEEAGPRSHRPAVHPCGHALCEQPLAGWHAHQLQHRSPAPRAAQGTRGDGLRRRGRLVAHQEGTADPASREGQTRTHPRRYPQHGEGAERHLGRRHQEGAHRRQGSPQAGDPRDRDPGH